MYAARLNAEFCNAVKESERSQSVCETPLTWRSKNDHGDSEANRKFLTLKKEAFALSKIGD